ncbi:hypothetical protein RRG08_026751 [Elysia crispata]|uniref:Uncharacterized protein n=1 Tax=Elysia crispata TaxID=231223 RepID=A0AAE1E3U3_9GAST|nr:hypothetical protein RRG08_026751 [Elysia crispata]
MFHEGSESQWKTSNPSQLSRLICNEKQRETTPEHKKGCVTLRSARPNSRTPGDKPRNEKCHACALSRSIVRRKRYGVPQITGIEHGISILTWSGLPLALHGRCRKVPGPCPSESFRLRESMVALKLSVAVKSGLEYKLIGLIFKARLHFSPKSSARTRMIIMQ